MTKINRPPKGEPWIWITRDLLASDAWRSMGGKERKVVDFLMLEHMAKGGRQNGNLKAPHRQLVASGISEHTVKAAIDECEELGLLRCNRAGMRVATTYSLTWLPLHDGTPATNEWREYRNPMLIPITGPKNQKSAPQTAGRAACSTAGRLRKTACSTAGSSTPKSAPQIAGALKKNSYQGAIDRTDLSVAAAPADEAAR